MPLPRSSSREAGRAPVGGVARRASRRLPLSSKGAKRPQPSAACQPRVPARRIQAPNPSQNPLPVSGLENRKYEKGRGGERGSRGRGSRGAARQQ